jgi:hypothetical protein
MPGGPCLARLSTRESTVCTSRWAARLAHDQMDPEYRGEAFADRLDKALARREQVQRIEGAAHLRVDVNAPRGTRTRLLKHTGRRSKT